MTLQASGQISFADINTELGRSSTAQIGINEAEAGTYGAINQASTSKPNGATPNAINEWYSYNHSAVATYSISVYAQCQTNAGVNAGKFYYRVNGGTSTLIRTTTVSTSPGYSNITSVTAVPITINPGDIIDFWVQNVSNTNIQFGTGNNSGTYSGFCGVGNPYTVTPSSSGTYYINLRVVGSAFPTC
jgi:hypothetical protein